MDKTTTVADVIVAQLEKSDVKRIYGLIGDSLNPLGAAVSKSKLEWIAVRNEEVAAFAAAGEAELSGKLCVCAGTCGPGSVHLINGLYEANRNSTPVLAIVSHIPTRTIGLDYFQNTHPERIFNDCSVFCEFLMNPEQLPLLIYSAIQNAIGKKGVAVLIIPGDVMAAPFSEAPKLENPVYNQPVYKAEEEEIQKLAETIAKYKKFTLYCGHGCKNAMPEVLKLADVLQAPCLYTLRAKEFAPINNPFAAGMLGYLATPSSKTAVSDCDCMIMLGCDFPYSVILPKTAAFIQIDVDGSHLGRRCSLNFGMTGDIKQVLSALLPKLKPIKENAHLTQSLKTARDEDTKLENALTQMAQEVPLRPEYLTSRISKTANENALFLIDVGLNDKWASRYITPYPNRRILGSFKHGTMAAAIGEAIGMAFAEPERQIIVLSGDGGLTMLLGDLLTLVQYKLPLKIVVYNNGTLGFIDFEAEMEGYTPFGTNYQNPDFSKVAEAMGLTGYRLENPKNTDEILQKAWKENGAVLIDARTDAKALGFL